MLLNMYVNMCVYIYNFFNILNFYGGNKQVPFLENLVYLLD